MSRLVANRAFRYESRQISADEEFEADNKDVRVLTHANNPLARLASASADGQETQDVEPDLLDPNKKTTRYNRRDMRAKE